MTFCEAEQQITLIEQAVKEAKQRAHQDHISPSLAAPAVFDAARRAMFSVTSTIVNENHVHNHSDPKTPMLVAHYTSVETAIALLEKTCHKDKDARYDHLRMYPSNTFNDPDEGRYLYRATGKTDQAENIGLLTPAGRSGNASYAYIASFVTPGSSEDPDDKMDNLALWRSYGRDGAGASLIATILPSNLLRVLYGKDDAQTTAHTMVHYGERILSAVKELNTPWMEERAKLIIHEQSQLVNYLYKSPAYRYENESRVIVLPNRSEDSMNLDTDYRNGRFHEFLNNDHLSTNPATGIFQSRSTIILGPRVRRRTAARKHLQSLVRQAGLFVPIQPSGISYRGTNNR